MSTKKNQTDDISKKVLKAILASGATGLTGDQLVALIPGVDEDVVKGLMVSGYLDISFSSSKHYSVTPYGKAWLALHD